MLVSWRVCGAHTTLIISKSGSFDTFRHRYFRFSLFLGVVFFQQETSRQVSLLVFYPESLGNGIFVIPCLCRFSRPQVNRLDRDETYFRKTRSKWIATTTIYSIYEHIYNIYHCYIIYSI